MKKNLQVVPLTYALLVSICSVLQAAEDIDNRWYLTPMLSYIKADNDRRADDDTGLLLGLGKSINKSWDIEVSVVNDKLAFKSGLNDYEQRGLMLDGLYFFDRQNTLQGYAILGTGVMETTVGAVSNVNPMFDAGVGVMRKISNNGIALRADIRYRLELDNNTVPYQSAFGDLMLNVGVRIPFGDNAPSTPAAVKAISADADNDGVPDDVDLCPASEETLSVDIHGCKLPPLFILEDVCFELNSDVLKAKAGKALQGVVATLKKNADYKIEVAGYTDDSGPVDFNQRLSQQRAVAVKVYLESMGVDTKQLTARGYGTANPVADNSTLKGRELNRRVELRILH